MARGRRKGPDNTKQQEVEYEYPDPELVQNTAYPSWPTNDLDDEGNPNDPQLRALGAVIRTTWPNGESDEEEDGDDNDDDDDLRTLEHQFGDVGHDEDDFHDDNAESGNEDSPSASASDEEVPTAPPKRGRPRGRPRGGRRGARSTGYDEDHPRNRKKKSTETRSTKGTKRGLRKTLPPSAKFTQLQGEATNCFIAGNYDKAEALANQAVVENPEQFSAHSLLSEIFYEKGDLERSIAALFAGAHVRMRDPDVWERSAELIIQRSGDLRLPKMLDDALYCYSRVITLDSERIDIRIARANLYQETGQPKKAVRDLQYVLKKSPDNLAIMRMLIDISMEVDDQKEAIAAYDNLISVLLRTEPQQAISFGWSDLYIYGEVLAQLEQPADSLKRIKRIARWICGRGTDDYWEFQTLDDREFDRHTEPRRIRVLHLAETDHDIGQYGEGLPLEIRVQLGIIRLQLNDKDEAMRHFHYLVPDTDDSIMAEDFPDLYRMVGEALREKKLFSDALIFLEPLRHLQDAIDSTFHAHLAYCYRQLGRLDDAETCYRTLIDNNDTDIRIRKEMVDMFHAAELQHRAAPYEKEIRLGKKRKYRPMFNSAGKDDLVAFREDPPLNGVNHALVPMITSLHEQVYSTHRQLMTASSTDPSNENEHADTEPITAEATTQVESIEKEEPIAPPKRHRQHHRKKAAQSEDQEDLRAAFLHIADLKGLLESGDDEARADWMSAARTLLRKFREARVFFPYDRNVKFYGYTLEARQRSMRTKPKQHEIDMELAEMLNIPVDQLPRDNVPTEFCEVPFDDWLDVFMEYSVMLAEDGKRQESYSVLDIAAACNVFYCNKAYMQLITLAGGICALLLDDDEKVSTVARFFMTAYQFNSDSYRLYAAFFRRVSRPNLGWFNSGVLQKFIMRQLKAVDFCLVDPENRALPMFEERSGFFNKGADGAPVLPTRLDVTLLFLYGHILYAAGSYTYALNYLYRARSLDPDHHLINLSLGLAYIHHAIKRQSINRHQLIMQGLVFIYQYRDKRMKSEFLVERQEAVFNLARTFHLLGLVHLAIPRYEKVLEMSEEMKMSRESKGSLGGEEEYMHQEDFAVDAAFVLQGLYAFAGNMTRAKQIVDKWMVL